MGDRKKAMVIERVGDLDIEQDVAFEEREWLVHRLGLTMMAIVVLAALAGLFGEGPLSLQTVANGDDGFSVTYERFGRRGKRTEVVVKARRDLVRRDELQVQLDTAYMENMQLEQVTPQPDKVVRTSEGNLYTFLVDGRSPIVSVTYTFTRDSMGPWSGTIAIPPAGSVELFHFYWP